MKNFIKIILLLTYFNCTIFSSESNKSSQDLNFFEKLCKNNSWQKVGEAFNPKNSTKKKIVYCIGLGLLANRIYIHRKLSHQNSFVKNISHRTLFTKIHKIHKIFKINNFNLMNDGNVNGNFIKKIIGVSDGLIRKLWPNNKNSVLFNSTLLSIFFLRNEIFSKQKTEPSYYDATIVNKDSHENENSKQKSHHIQQNSNEKSNESKLE